MGRVLIAHFSFWDVTIQDPKGRGSSCVAAGGAGAHGETTCAKKDAIYDCKVRRKRRPKFGGGGGRDPSSPPSPRRGGSDGGALQGLFPEITVFYYVFVYRVGVRDDASGASNGPEAAVIAYMSG